jgi:hypothetical protein
VCTINSLKRLTRRRKPLRQQRHSIAAGSARCDGEIGDGESRSLVSAA